MFYATEPTGHRKTRSPLPSAPLPRGHWQLAGTGGCFRATATDVRLTPETQGVGLPRGSLWCSVLNLNYKEQTRAWGSPNLGLGPGKGKLQLPATSFQKSTALVSPAPVRPHVFVFLNALLWLWLCNCAAV
jgi:hypothetical protein